MILDLRTESEGRIIVSKVGNVVALIATPMNFPASPPLAMSKKEAGRVWAALGKALRDPEA